MTDAIVQIARSISPFMLATGATTAVFVLARRLYTRTGFFLLNPVLVSMLVLMAALYLLDVDYEVYARGARPLTVLLGPAVVALGLPLYRQSATIYRRRRSLLLGIGGGSLVGVAAGTLVAFALGAPPEVVRSLTPRSVTTPIAIGIAAENGGLPALTAALVIASGVLGAVVGPPLLRRAGVHDPTAVGLALGAAAHGIGTARAAELGQAQAAAAGLAVGLMGAATALLTPFFLRIFDVILAWF